MRKCSPQDGRAYASGVHLFVHSFIKHLLFICHVLSPGPCPGMKACFEDTVLHSGNPCNHERSPEPSLGMHEEEAVCVDFSYKKTEIEEKGEMTGGGVGIQEGF